MGYIVAFEGLKFRYFPSVKRAARYTWTTPGRTRSLPAATSDATVPNSSASVQIGHQTSVPLSPSWKAVVRILRACGTVGKRGIVSIARRFAPGMVLIVSHEGSP